MKLLRGGLIAGLSFAALVLFSPRALAASAGDADGTPHLLTELQFNSTTPLKTTTSTTSVSLDTAALGNPDWSIGAQHGGSVGVQATGGPGGNSVDAVEGVYPNPPSGGQYLWAVYSVAALNTEDIYIEFWAKMPGAKGGCKFIKIFGKDTNSTNYANTTIATNYTGGDYGSIHQLSFGDGTNLANDTQNAINLNGQNPQAIGRSYGTATVLTPQMSAFSSTDWGTGWHHFRIHIKFNSGTTSQNEVPDGEYYLEIDGKVYADATGLYNRNPANGPIDRVGFFGLAQSDPSGFQLWYDDIRISTGAFTSTSTASDGGVSASDGGVSAPDAAGGTPDGGVSASDGGVSAPDAAGGTPDGGNAVGADAGPGGARGEGGGCGCTVGGSRPAAPTPWFALAAIALTAWRRRRSSDD